MIIQPQNSFTMKKYFRAFLSGVLVFFVLSAQAQSASGNNCDWISDKGYWVVESNKHTPKDAIVYFYNNDNLLVYKEEIRGQKLKLTRKKTLYRLKAALEEAISNNSTRASNRQLIAKHLQD